MADPSQIYTVRQRRGARRRVLPSCTVQLPGASFEVNVIRLSLLSRSLSFSYIPHCFTPLPQPLSFRRTLAQFRPFSLGPVSDERTLERT